MLVAIIVAAILAVFMVEAVFALMGTDWLKIRLAKLKASFLAFQRALDDADRQRLITRAGLLTCGLSIVSAACILTLLSLILLPPYLMQWATDVDQIYFASLSLFSLVWLIFRRKVLKA